jgi:hypothetical protein
MLTGFQPITDTATLISIIKDYAAATVETMPTPNTCLHQNQLNLKTVNRGELVNRAPHPYRMSGEAERLLPA